MQNEIYARLRRLAEAAARGLPEPAFYKENMEAIRSADETLRGHSLIKQCRAELDSAALECAHGVCHCETVARDAGAIVLIEGPRLGMTDEVVQRLHVAAEIAGLLHDIKRKEQDHALLGSIEAGRILSKLRVQRQFADIVTAAIRNHEAFKEYTTSDNMAEQLVSDALYDADKFRWGAENFTTTLWLIMESRGTSPEDLHKGFLEKMKGIERIKETFRTGTGRRYGPEFIDQGLEIGNLIYRELSCMLAA